MFVHNDLLEISNMECDLEKLFDSADENGVFAANPLLLKNEVHNALEYGLEKTYCKWTTVDTFTITELGRSWLAEYKNNIEQWSKLALHTV